MNHAFPLFAPLLALVLAAGCKTTAPAPDAAPAHGVPSNLRELVERYQGHTGFNVTFHEATAELLTSIPVTRLGPEELGVLLIGSKEVAPRAAAFEAHVVPLEFADASELAASLNGLFADASRPARSQVRIQRDERTNALVVYAPQQQLRLVLDLVAALDVEQH